MKAYYRTRQFIMGMSIRVLAKREPVVIKKSGALYEVPGLLAESGKKKVFVTTTPGFIRRGTLEPFFEKLKEQGIEMTLYSDITPDPTIECVEEGVKKYLEGSCEAIVAIGGGSVIDCSKAVAARIVCPQKTVRDMRGVLKIRKTLPDFYAVPTTAGTGSETTAAAVITDTINGTHYKYAVNDFCLIPKYAVLDPDLTLALPKGITATTGMDALTHAIEAYTNRFASGKVKEYALSAVRLIYENLYKCYENGSDVEARENMLYGSFEAGIAFTNNFVGYVHAVAHALGGLYGIAHGEANAIILPYIMEQFGDSAIKELSELADAAGINGNSEREKAANFVKSIREMNEKMGLPEKVSQLKKEDFTEIINRAIKEANPLYPVPAIWGREDFEILLNKLYGGNE